MNRPDHSTYREWLNLEADDRLSRDERARLEEHLATCPECRNELRERRALDDLLLQNRVAVRSGFRDDVLAALPVAGWEARSPRTWSLPAAAFVLLGMIAAAVLVFHSSGFGSASSGLSALFAVGGLFKATLLAGAGLLAATWKGAGLVFQELLSSPVNLGMFGVLVLCLNLLLISMVRRRRPGHQPHEAAPRSLDDTKL